MRNQWPASRDDVTVVARIPCALRECPDDGSPTQTYIPLVWNWIVIGILYLFGIGFFRWLGGIGAAADAIKSWGRVYSDRRRRTSSSSA